MSGSSAGAYQPSSASEPAVVIMGSEVSMLSLMSTGTPCSAPRTRARSSACAISKAWIGLDDRGKLGSPAIQGLDPLKIVRGELRRAQAPGLHGRDHSTDAELVERE